MHVFELTTDAGTHEDVLNMFIALHEQGMEFEVRAACAAIESSPEILVRGLSSFVLLQVLSANGAVEDAFDQILAVQLTARQN